MEQVAPRELRINVRQVRDGQADATSEGQVVSGPRGPLPIGHR